MKKIKTHSYQIMILKKHSPDKADDKGNFQENDFADNDRFLQKEKLGYHMVLQPDISKDHDFHDQGRYERLYTSLYFNNALQGYICKICEMYVMSSWWQSLCLVPYSCLKKTLAIEFVIIRSPWFDFTSHDL